MDDAIWAAEKAVQKAKMELKEASVLMDEIKLRPQLMTLKAWLWASATVSMCTLLGLPLGFWSLNSNALKFS